MLMDTTMITLSKLCTVICALQVITAFLAKTTRNLVLRVITQTGEPPHVLAAILVIIVPSKEQLMLLCLLRSVQQVPSAQQQLIL